MDPASSLLPVYSQQSMELDGQTAASTRSSEMAEMTMLTTSQHLNSPIPDFLQDFAIITLISATPIPAVANPTTLPVHSSVLNFTNLNTGLLLITSTQAYSKAYNTTTTTTITPTSPFKTLQPSIKLTGFPEVTIGDFSDFENRKHETMQSNPTRILIIILSVGFAVTFFVALTLLALFCMQYRRARRQNPKASELVSYRPTKGNHTALYEPMRTMTDEAHRSPNITNFVSRPTDKNTTMDDRGPASSLRAMLSYLQRFRIQLIPKNTKLYISQPSAGLFTPQGRSQFSYVDNNCQFRSADMVQTWRNPTHQGNSLVTLSSLNHTCAGKNHMNQPYPSKYAHITSLEVASVGDGDLAETPTKSNNDLGDQAQLQELYHPESGFSDRPNSGLRSTGQSSVTDPLSNSLEGQLVCNCLMTDYNHPVLPQSGRFDSSSQSEDHEPITDDQEAINVISSQSSVLPKEAYMSYYRQAYGISNGSIDSQIAQIVTPGANGYTGYLARYSVFPELPHVPSDNRASSRGVSNVAMEHDVDSRSLRSSRTGILDELEIEVREHDKSALVTTARRQSYLLYGIPKISKATTTVDSSINHSLGPTSGIRNGENERGSMGLRSAQ